MSNHAYANGAIRIATMGVLSAGIWSGFGHKRLRLGALKVMTDGSSSGRTAATREPHTSNAQDCGILYWDQDGLDNLLGRVHQQVLSACCTPWSTAPSRKC
jgi:predicted amidohydrolase YtcJ